MKRLEDSLTWQRKLNLAQMPELLWKQVLINLQIPLKLHWDQREEMLFLTNHLVLRSSQMMVLRSQRILSWKMALRIWVPSL